jgi:transcriptional regulator with XRE-family HTH domain
MEIKDILKNRRIELGLTMKEVSEMVGVSEATISRWESGDIANMRRNKISALANALQMPPAVIMGWEEPPTYYVNPATAKMAQELTEPVPERDLSALKWVLSEDIEELYWDFTPQEKRRFWRAIIKEIRWGSDRSTDVIFL